LEVAEMIRADDSIYNLMNANTPDVNFLKRMRTLMNLAGNDILKVIFSQLPR
jgi:hypothetical protein